MRNRSRVVTRSARPARPMDWECAQAAVTLTGNSIACTWIVLPSRVREGYTDPTLMASRWFVSARILTGGASLTSFVGWGLIAWDSTTDADPNPCPDPIANCDLDWINRYVVPVPFSPVGTIIEQPFDNVHLSKAKRRLGQDRGILLVFSQVGGFDVALGADVRCLIKE